MRRLAAQRQKLTRKRSADDDCIRAAGADPASVKRRSRAAVIRAGRAVKAKAKSAKQAMVKRLHSRRLRLAMPAWADKAAMRAVYAEAQRLTLETGQRHEVDHVIPLLGKTVSGLHVEYNLQVLPMPDNRRKSNR
jgi:hypothetical protein